MSETPEPQRGLRRACVIWYDESTNSVSVEAPDFSWLELPELLRTALDYAELNLPTCELEEEGASDD